MFQRPSNVDASFAVKEAAGSGRWFILMNYGVHSLMYSYYALAAGRE